MDTVQITFSTVVKVQFEKLAAIAQQKGGDAKSFYEFLLHMLRAFEYRLQEYLLQEYLLEGERSIQLGRTRSIKLAERLSSAENAIVVEIYYSFDGTSFVIEEIRFRPDDHPTPPNGPRLKGAIQAEQPGELGATKRCGTVCALDGFSADIGTSVVVDTNALAVDADYVAGGAEIVVAGGSDLWVCISSGTETISSGGVATNHTIVAGSQMVSSGGTQSVSESGTASGGTGTTGVNTDKSDAGYFTGGTDGGTASGTASGTTSGGTGVNMYESDTGYFTGATAIGTASSTAYCSLICLTYCQPFLITIDDLIVAKKEGNVFKEQHDLLSWHLRTTRLPAHITEAMRAD